jgi:hypothetical protein
MKDFEIGGLYFWIRYADDKRLYLVPKAMVFLGKNLDPSANPDNWCFQGAESYCVYGPETFSQPFDRNIANEEFVRIASETLPTKLVSLLTGDLNQMVDCEGLANALRECAEHRNRVGKPA